MTKAMRNGTVSELLAEQWFVKQDYIVSKPINDFGEYDFIADGNGHLTRIQVKTVYWDEGKQRWVARCATGHRDKDAKWKTKKYSLDSFDYAAFVCAEHGIIYLIPIELIAERSRVTFYPDEKNVPGRDSHFERYKRRLFS